MSNPSGHRRPGAGRGLRIAGWAAAAAVALLMIKWVLITVVLLAVPFALWWVVDRAGRGRRIRTAQAAAAASTTRRRAELESLAVVDAAGGCGWCGARTAHRDRAGRLVMPREHHHDDIEDAVAAV